MEKMCDPGVTVEHKARDRGTKGETSITVSAREDSAAQAAGVEETVSDLWKVAVSEYVSRCAHECKFYKGQPNQIPQSYSFSQSTIPQSLGEAKDTKEGG